METTNTGLKFNWTAKEKAIRKLDEDKKEMESLQAYQTIMGELNLELY